MGFALLAYALMWFLFVFFFFFSYYGFACADICFQVVLSACLHESWEKEKKEKGVICALSFECTVSCAKHTESAHHHLFFLFPVKERGKKKPGKKKDLPHLLWLYPITLRILVFFLFFFFLLKQWKKEIKRTEKLLFFFLSLDVAACASSSFFFSIVYFFFFFLFDDGIVLGGKGKQEKKPGKKKRKGKMATTLRGWLIKNISTPYTVRFVFLLPNTRPRAWHLRG